MSKILRLVDEHTAEGKYFAILIQVMIIVSMVMFTLETLPELNSIWHTAFFYSEAIIVGVFCVEYALRIIHADRPVSFIFSFYGIIDLLAIIPFFLISGLDLRSVRIIRLLRLLRILKLFRYSKAVKRLRNAFKGIREELILFGFIVLTLLYLASVGIYCFENEAQPEAFKSILHSMWWAVSTLTTVGYGDIYPVTAGGKFFTFIVLMLGLGIVAVPTGLVASALTENRYDEKDTDNNNQNS